MFVLKLQIKPTGLSIKINFIFKRQKCMSYFDENLEQVDLEEPIAGSSVKIK